MKFTDLSQAHRMSIREGITAAGADCIDYLGDGRISVALPASQPMAVVSKIEALGFKETGGHYFPIGTANTPEKLRHFGPGTAAAPRGDQPSYWLWWTFELTIAPEPATLQSLRTEEEVTL